MKFQKGDIVYFCDIETQEENQCLDSDTYPIVWCGHIEDIDEHGYISVKLDKNRRSNASAIEGTIEDLLYRTPEEAVCEFLSDMRQKLEEQIKELRGGSR